MKKYLLLGTLVTIAAATIGVYAFKSMKREHATCYGNSPCNACKNCKYCGHCAKGGGTCGACK